ncbi:heterotrimeric GTP-binding alpha subunit [Lentinula raphanica]|uniref:Heterotrimeric GTP-binding alpha subunit n=1 Tax=Lentinula raphanica TaxID=153919 RepID=A0AA38UFS0_9AGAR|nr:heterotrimeric GTP-binding alpha subunit [Lentinula raphanica]KAJ3971413.1 heterotrimeric GTP-binding alpha subunit [Lentinula raphanica]
MVAISKFKQKQRATMELSENPFIVAFKAPANETEEERIRRVRAFQDAQRVSRQIDESLQEAKRILDRRKRATRILLLGQAESGKSAVLKNFQLAFTPQQFQKERDVWKTIIQLNLISSVRTLLNILNDVDPNGQSLMTPPHTPGSHSNSPLNSKLRRIHLVLSPLLSMETDLKNILFSAGSSPREIRVTAGTTWKSKLGFRDSATSQQNSQLTNAQNIVKTNLVKLLEASKNDIDSLWKDEDTQRALQEREINLRDSPGFFLDDVERITSPSYQPTDSDIVRARVRTDGVEEHHLVLETARLKGNDFYITDVSGMRSARHSWIPFFDDAQAILFLAPLMFNQMLEEDPHVNRLEDSLLLWKEICSNVLLANCNIIIFFNKMDILRRTLESGVEVRKYVPSYGDAPNEVASVTKYFKDRFKGYHRKLSPKPRTFIAHETSAIDIHSTTALVITVHEGIIRDNLEKSDMI